MPEQEYDTSVPVETEASETTEPVTPEVPAVEGAEQAPEATPEVGTAMPTFTVTVDGEQFEVSAEEAIAGYQRQADYTRKTQALASEREQNSRAQQLWDAIEANPQKTIAAIADAYGLKLTPAEAAAAAQQQAGTADPFEDLYEEGTPTATPEDPRWEAVAKFMQEQTLREQTSAIEAELVGVREKYGIKIADPSQFNQSLVEYAIENDIGSLDAAFRAMSFEAAQQAAARRSTANRKQALPPVASGHPVQAGVLAPGAGSALPSFEEAFAAAEAELNA